MVRQITFLLSYLTIFFLYITPVFSASSTYQSIEMASLKHPDQYLKPSLLHTPFLSNILLKKLKKPIVNTTGVEFQIMYTSLGQFASQGEPRQEAIGNDLDILGVKEFLKDDTQSTLARFHCEQRYKSTLIPPSSLNKTFHSVLETAQGFDMFPMSLVELWGEQRLFRDHVIIRAGDMIFRHVINDYAFNNEKDTFLGVGFTGHPAITEPDDAITLVADLMSPDHYYAALSIMDSRNMIALVAKDRVYFKAIEWGYRDTFLPTVSKTNYHVMLWQADESPSQLLKEAHGLSLTLQGEIAPGLLPFFKFDINNGRGAPLQQLIATGVGISHPFGQDYSVLGLGGVYGKPSDPQAGNEYTIEAFYRVQFTPILAVTPDVQLMEIKPYRENRKLVRVFSLRVNILI